MKRAEQLAWAALTGLIVIALILLTGGIIYRFTGFWAGMMLMLAQAVTAGLAAWGLMLARQAAELNEFPGMGAKQRKADASNTTSGFRMSLGDDVQNTPARVPGDIVEAKTLDTGFQRLLVGIAAAIMLILGAVTIYLVYAAHRWGVLNPDKPLPIVGTYAKPAFMDELGLVIGLAAAGIYGVLWWVTRVRRDTEGYGDAVSSGFILGIGGMTALGIATVLAYLRVSYASEVAAAIIAALMVLQGLELVVNSIRSYSSIEELDQEAVDLQALPLVPMMSSAWLGSLKILFAQSVGLSGREGRESSVIARMMPRALLAILVIAILMSCLRVVTPGEVAVLERLGYAPTEANGRLTPAAILQPGLHMTMPWPIDKLVKIPTQELQRTDVGTELHAPKAWGKNLDFQFWQLRDTAEADGADDLFITGDPAPQLLETYIQVRWRVADPAAFYTAISHSEFFERSAGETKALPIYEALVQQCTSYAVTRTFAIHSLNQIMIDERREVEAHCREILQEKLNALGSGVEVAYLTIKDLHPPFWRPDRPDPTEPRIGGLIRFTDEGIRIEDDPQNPGRSRVGRGPASAFEFVISMREFRESLIAVARADSVGKINFADGFAKSEVARAQAYRLDKVAQAHGDADRLVKMTESMDPKTQQYQLSLMKQQLLYATVRDLLAPVSKVIVDPEVSDVQIWQVLPTERPSPLVNKQMLLERMTRIDELMKRGFACGD